MNIVIDMNLSPDWVTIFQQQSWTAVHWSSIGDPRAEDTVILDWARTNGHIVFTHDLDFGRLLALTRATGPSVIQIRTEDILPESISNLVVTVLKRYESELASGALITIDKRKSRVRILPI
jgi:predicted nuclease of predicted toxin-antitoxin system